jgi:glycosyltransferase involved in cell wall biosynthesis
VRVGVLTTSYPRDDDDPAGGFVAGFARWLAAHVGDVEVLCADAARPLFYRGGAPTALARPGAWPGALAFSTRLWAAARRRAARWDALVTHWLVPSGAIGLALAGRRPHVAIAHGSDARLLARLPFGPSLLRRLARRADLIAVARALGPAARLGRVQPMGIDVAAHAAVDAAAARARLALGAGEFVVGFLGRLVRDKGADLALDALPDGATLLVAGDGPERGALDERARARGARVRLLGELRGAAKRDLLGAVDALIVPSRSDGAPTVVLEALAAGRPIVATCAGGIPELVRDGETALLCDATPDALGRALARLRREPSLAAALSRAAADAARAHDWSVVGPRLAAVLPRGLGGTIDVTRV